MLSALPSSEATVNASEATSKLVDCDWVLPRKTEPESQELDSEDVSVEEFKAAMEEDDYLEKLDRKVSQIVNLGNNPVPADVQADLDQMANAFASSPRRSSRTSSQQLRKDSGASANSFCSAQISMVQNASNGAISDIQEDIVRFDDDDDIHDGNDSSDSSDSRDDDLDHIATCDDLDAVHGHDRWSDDDSDLENPRFMLRRRR